MSDTEFKPQRQYLLIVFSPAADADHANILKAVQFHSGGDFVEVFKQAATVRGGAPKGQDVPFTVAYLFSTSSLPNQMGFGTLDRDRYLLVQLAPGGWHWHEKLSVAHQWLDRHR